MSIDRVLCCFASTAVLTSLAQGASQRIVRVVEDPGSSFGLALARIDDVDGDGVRDLAVGQPNGFNHVLQASTGLVKVFSPISGDQVGQVLGSQDGEGLGIEIAVPGDLDGDGRLDFAVAATQWNGQFANSVGRISWLGSDLAPLPGFADATSSLLAARTGTGLVAVDDCNGDGLTDVLSVRLGSPLSDESMAVIHASGTGEVIRVHPLGTNTAGSNSVVSLGDLDGDGLRDYGITRITAGAVAHLEVRSAATGARLFEFAPPTSNLRLHSKAIRWPDLNQDGVDEVAIAWREPTFSQVAADLVAVYDGSSRTLIRTLPSLNSFNSLGPSLDAEGDFDGDGVNDLIVARPGSAQSGQGPRFVQVYSGRTFAELMRAVEDSFRYPLFGVGVTYCGNVDGQPGDEFAISAPSPPSSFHPDSLVRIYGYDRGVGSPVCDPAVPNSSGHPGTLRLVGTAHTSDNDLAMQAHGLPVGSFCIGLTAFAEGFVPNLAGQDGTLCLGGPIGRIGGTPLPRTDAYGSVTVSLDLTGLASAMGPLSVMPGERWFMQLWYRDANPTSTANLTNAVEILFE